MSFSVFLFAGFGIQQTLFYTRYSYAANVAVWTDPDTIASDKFLWYIYNPLPKIVINI
jgi:hypothetical protein